jgi:hypothetical protein
VVGFEDFLLVVQKKKFVGVIRAEFSWFCVVGSSD